MVEFPPKKGFCAGRSAGGRGKGGRTNLVEDEDVGAALVEGVGGTETGKTTADDDDSGHAFLVE